MGGGLHSHYIVKPNLVLRLGWGFDNCIFFLILGWWEPFQLGSWSEWWLKLKSSLEKPFCGRVQTGNVKVIL